VLNEGFKELLLGFKRRRKELFQFIPNSWNQIGFQNWKLWYSKPEKGYFNSYWLKDFLDLGREFGLKTWKRRYS